MCLWKTLRSDGPISYNDRSELEINQPKSLIIEGLSFHLPPFSLLDLVIYFANVWNEKEADINARERRDFEEDEVKSHIRLSSAQPFNFMSMAIMQTQIWELQQLYYCQNLS